MIIVLTKSTKVRGKDMVAGQKIECSEKEGKLWVALGWARDEAEDQADLFEEPARKKYQRRGTRAVV